MSFVSEVSAEMAVWSVFLKKEVNSKLQLSPSFFSTQCSAIKKYNNPKIARSSNYHSIISWNGIQGLAYSMIYFL